MSSQLITLTTDFGEGSPYVAQMKAAVLKVNPDAKLIDVTHAVEPQDLHYAALVLADVAYRFPSRTIHVCVVDPGVGTQRKIVYAAIGDQQFIAPDNGLLSLIARQQPVSQVIRLESPEFRQHPVSATFHGRDIMAPAAAHLTLGTPPQKLGTQQDNLVQLDLPEVECQPCALIGTVLAVDHFGNLITNITRELLPRQVPISSVQVTCCRRTCKAWVNAYGDTSPGSLIALMGSSDRLEIAVAQGNAAGKLGANVGDRVDVTWR